MMEFPAIKQQSKNDCGLICVQIIAKYYGVESNSTPQNSHTHLSIDDVTTYAELLGFKHFSFHSSYSWLVAKVPRPFIVHWRNNHFMVVYHLTQNRASVSDPATGQLHTLSKGDFVGGWLGHIKSKNAWKEGIVIYLEKKN